MLRENPGERVSHQDQPVTIRGPARRPSGVLSGASATGWGSVARTPLSPTGLRLGGLVGAPGPRDPGRNHDGVALSHVITIRGESYRLREKRRSGLLRGLMLRVSS